jgi:hypothetical protein
MGALALAHPPESLDDVVLDALARGARPRAVAVCPVCAGTMHRTSSEGEPIELRCESCLSVLADGEPQSPQPVQLRLVT